MKTKHRIHSLLAVAALSLATAGYSQSETNIPSVGLGQEKFGLSSGAVTEGENVRATVIGDYNFSQHFYVRGEIQSSADNTVIANLGVGVGFQISWPTVRVYAGPTIRYSWDSREFQALVGAGVAYQPIQNGILADWSVFSEVRLVTPFNDRIRREPPHREFVGGIRKSFR